jgi:regulator of sirC expression with transglutaminase-like and TPR domain
VNDDERRRALETAVRQGSRPGGLARACLLVARGAYPRLDPTVSLAEIERLAALVLEARKKAPKRHAADVLASVLGRKEGFGGAVVDYDDPEMSYLNRVLARRRGLPILLSIVWIEVARGAGIPARPLPFPGHFAALVDGEIVDPSAAGRRMSEDEVLSLFDAAGGRAPPIRRAATPRRVMLRVLANLANTYERRGDGRRLDVVLTDQLSLVPKDPHALAVRGEARARFDDRAGALADLGRAIPGLPPGPEFERACSAALALVRIRESVN